MIKVTRERKVTENMELTDSEWTHFCGIGALKFLKHLERTNGKIEDYDVWESVVEYALQEVTQEEYGFESDNIGVVTGYDMKLLDMDSCEIGSLFIDEVCDE